MPDFVEWRRVAPFKVVTKEDILPHLRWGARHWDGRPRATGCAMTTEDATGAYGREELAAIEFAVLLRATRFYGTASNSMLSTLVHSLRQNARAAAVVAGAHVAAASAVQPVPLWNRMFYESHHMMQRVTQRQRQWLDNPPPFMSPLVHPLPLGSGKGEATPAADTSDSSMDYDTDLVDDDHEYGDEEEEAEEEDDEEEVEAEYDEDEYYDDDEEVEDELDEDEDEEEDLDDDDDEDDDDDGLEDGLEDHEDEVVEEEEEVA